MQFLFQQKRKGYEEEEYMAGPKERMVHRLKGCPGRWSWKVASEPES